ncbi:MAG: hypothetical protein D8M59_09355 [Planctomycetes bacterium]|nr:hypothetical protein [Planctomycetota bacterium]NOG54268.1 hypothetical protein [Planctomycetota bacterium]
MNTEQILSNLVARLGQSDLFLNATATSDRIECQAAGCVGEAQYRAEWDGSQWWVSLVTADRWLSESIEADLMHTGDAIEELLEDELVDLGLSGRPAVEHYRSDDLLYTFRSRVGGADETPDAAETADRVFTWLSAYEACFRELGDVAQSDAAD